MVFFYRQNCRRKATHKQIGQRLYPRTYPLDYKSDPQYKGFKNEIDR